MCGLNKSKNEEIKQNKKRKKENGEIEIREVLRLQTMCGLL
jgi:hypothetical protein